MNEQEEFDHQLWAFKRWLKSKVMPEKIEIFKVLQDSLNEEAKELEERRAFACFMKRKMR